MMRKLSKSELINHPIRIRILGALGPRSLTPKQISEAIPDVPQATLYRQIKVLHEGGLLTVVSQRQAHGIMESTYAKIEGAAHLTREEFAAMSPEEHKTCLALLQTHASSELGRYVGQPKYDTTAEGMTYFAADLLLTDEESRQLRLDLIDLLRRYFPKPSEGRRARRITVSLIPEPNS